MIRCIRWKLSVLVSRYQIKFHDKNTRKSSWKNRKKTDTSLWKSIPRASFVDISPIYHSNDERVLGEDVVTSARLLFRIHRAIRGTVCTRQKETTIYAQQRNMIHPLYTAKSVLRSSSEILNYPSFLREGISARVTNRLLKLQLRYNHIKQLY